MSSRSGRLRQGQIRWLEVPGAKRRPALVIARDGVIDHLSEVLVIPLTTKHRGLDTEIELGTADGVRRPSVANAQNVSVVHRSHLLEPIGELSAGRWPEVCNAVAVAIGC